MSADRKSAASRRRRHARHNPAHRVPVHETAGLTRRSFLIFEDEEPPADGDSSEPLSGQLSMRRIEDPDDDEA
jgi:hypothetical protein